MANRKFKQTEAGLIPEDWDFNTLGDLVEKIFCGRDPSGGKQSHSEEETDYRIIQSAPVFDGHLDQSKVGHISKKMYEELNSASLVRNDVLLNQLGDGITFARSCVVPDEVLPAVITRSVGCIRCNQKKLNPWFLNAFLILPQTKRYIESFNSGSSRRAIDGSKMKSFTIPLPPLEEQEFIGRFYKDLQDKIELLRQQNATLEAIGQALFKHWFVDFEFPDEKGRQYKSSGGEMVESELGEIPKGWKLTILPDVASIVDCLHTKKPERQSTGRILLQLFNLGQHATIQLNETYFVAEEDYREWTKNIEVDQGDVVVTNAGLVGAIGQIPTGLKAGIGRNLTSIRPRTVPPTYLLQFLRSKHGVAEVSRNTDEGTIFSSLNVKGIHKLRIILPARNTAYDFESKARPLREGIEMNIIQIQTLSQLRDSLLPKLMSGKIRVPT